VGVETILGFSGRLYEVGQLSYVHVWVIRVLITNRALEEIRPGRYDQDTTIAGRYGAEFYIRETVVPLHHSAYTLGEDHISIHRGKKHYQQDQRKNRLL
jgi:hypothetical protein